MNYNFDVEDAIKYGVNEAIFINNLRFWILKNMANDKHFHEGRTWTYNSQLAFERLFPFWTRKSIRIIIKSLVKQNIILTGNFNKSNMDNTTWYAFVDNSEFMAKLGPIGQIIHSDGMRAAEEKRASSPIGCPLAQKGQPLAQKGQPIPDIKHTDEKIKDYSPTALDDSQFLTTKDEEPVLNEVHDEEADLEKEFLIFWEKYPRKEKKKRALKAFSKVEGWDLIMYRILEAIEEQEEKRKLQARTSQAGWCEDWPLAATWLNDCRWRDQPYVNTRKVNGGRYVSQR